MIFTKKLQNWLEQLPNAPHQEESILDIIRLSEDENAISSLLAYFLQPNNSHEQGTLFLAAFVHILQGHSDLEQSHFLNAADLLSHPVTVVREQDKIDIIIFGGTTPNDWAIIIENKVNFKKLDNPLSEYWKKTKATNKLGVVLSLNHIAFQVPEDTNYLSVLHEQWLERVLEQLAQQSISIHDKPTTRHEMIRNDFLKRMEYLTNTKKMKDQLTTEIPMFFKFYPQIKKLKEIEATLVGYVSEVMSENGFTTGRTSSDHAFYRKKGNKSRKDLELYVGLDQLFNGELGVVFQAAGKKDYELHGKIIAKYKELGWFTRGEKVNGALRQGFKNGNCYQIGLVWTVSIKLETPELIKAKIRHHIYTSFFKKDTTGKSFIDIAYNITA
jgi:hypothetical protein